MAKLAVDLVHVPTELFQHALQAIEYRIQGRLISGEMGAYKISKTRGVTIFFAPELSHLPQASLNSRALRRPIPGGQFIVQSCARSLYPRW